MTAAPGISVALYEAETLLGPDGAVEWWEPSIDDADAIVRLKDGDDIVVRGPDRRTNRNKAMELMIAAHGGFEEDMPHGGRVSLPTSIRRTTLPKGFTLFMSLRLGTPRRENDEVLQTQIARPLPVAR